MKLWKYGKFGDLKFEKSAFGQRNYGKMANLMF